MIEPTSINQAGFRYVPGYLDENCADSLLCWFLTETIWRSEEVTLFGKRHLVPRLIAWFGSRGQSYRYSGQDHIAQGWPGELLSLRSRIGGELGSLPDFLLLNRYRSGEDAMGWHTDDEVQPLAAGPLSHYIASVSLGATRRFLLRPCADQPSVPLDLEHGSLLLMDPRIPHTLPRTRRSVTERVNASFRVLT